MFDEEIVSALEAGEDPWEVAARLFRETAYYSHTTTFEECEDLVFDTLKRVEDWKLLNEGPE